MDPDQILEGASGNRPIKIAMDGDDMLKLFIVFFAAFFLGGILVQIAAKNI